MIGEMRKFLAEDKREKLMRWLGWIQGAATMLQIYTIAETANHITFSGVYDG